MSEADGAIRRIGLERDAVDELAPLLRRVVELDAESVLRIRVAAGNLTGLVLLPFGVLAGRTIAVPSARPAPGSAATGPAVTGLDVAGLDVAGLDVTWSCAQTLAWLDGERDEPPRAVDDAWRGAVPPIAGWRRIGSAPDSEVRPLVRAGALTLKQAAAREGAPDTQPRAQTADAVLDAVVLTFADGARPVEVTVRMLSAVTRLGFLPRGSYVAVDTVGRWVRVAAAYGSVFAERGGLTLSAQ